MLQIPYYLAILQWCLLALLCALVVLMYRQLALYLEVNAGPRPTYGPTAGMSVAGFTWTTSEGGTEALHRGGQPAMLLVADPTCEACIHALETLEDLRGDDVISQVRILVLTKEPRVFVEASPAFRESSYPVGYIDKNVVDRLDAHMTPLAISVGADGRVRTSGAAWTADQLKLYSARSMSEIEDSPGNGSGGIPVAQVG